MSPSKGEKKSETIMKPEQMDNIQLMQWVVEYQVRIKGDIEKKYNCEADNFDPDVMHMRNSLLLIELGRRGLSLEDVQTQRQKTFDCKHQFKLIGNPSPQWNSHKCKICGSYGSSFLNGEIYTIGEPYFLKDRQVNKTT